MLTHQVKDYIKMRQVISLRELANHFDVSEPAMEGILKLWLDRGVIQLQQGFACKKTCLNGSCQKKNPYYQYI